MQPRHLVRSRINDRLTHAAEYPITLLVAPAGFGKSVALRDYVATSRLDAVRYDVRREDGSLFGFARGLTKALEPVAPSALAAFAAMQQRAMQSGDAALEVCEWLCEHLRGFAGTIVVDDLHVAAADPSAAFLLTELVDRTAERIRWVLASRSDAGLPVATWLAYGRMEMPLDEGDLSFTVGEALAAAQEAGSDVDAREIEALHDLTEGWPVALSLALRTRTNASDLRASAAGPRELIYRYLAEAVFNGLSSEQRAFVTRTSVFSGFDSTVARSLGATKAFLADLRRDVAFLAEVEPGNYRYHELFREFAENELLRSGEREWREAMCAAARILEQSGNLPQALALYARGGDADAILRLVERDGIALFERGHAEVLGIALDAVPESRRASEAAAIGLRAMISAALGHFEIARGEFAAAIDLAKDDALRYALVHRYALELVRNDHDCTELLQRYAGDDSVAGPLRLPLLGTLATALERRGLRDEARTALTAAFSLLGAGTNDDARARLFQQAAYVSLGEASHEDAREYAELAVELSLSRNLYEVAVRAYSILYQIAYDDDDDPIAALAVLDVLLDTAVKGGSTQARLFGLMASYWIEAERGNEAALDRIEKMLAANRGSLPRTRVEAMLPAMALRAAWSGDFARAYELLRGSHEGLDAERAAYRAAEEALYAFAAGLSREAEEALAVASALMGDGKPLTRRALAARVVLAMAELARGHSAAAHRRLLEVERAADSSARRLRVFADGVRAVYRLQLGQIEEPALSVSTERLRSAHLGGIARLLEAVPFPGKSKGAYASLTAAEREILLLLATDATTKEVAAKTGRSPRTVETHIRSICAKLGCSGRSAAVAIAIRSGWV